MNRTLEDIQAQIYNKIAETEGLAELTSTSKVAIWRLWVYIVSFAIWTHELIVESNAKNSRPHTLRWYRNEALNFLDGLALVWNDGQFQYDVTGLDDLDERRIIDRCAVLERPDGKLIVKIATENDGELEPLDDDQLLRFTEYINDIKDAGNQIIIVNNQPDLINIDLTLYVNEQIFDLETGLALNTVEDVYPALDAINNYLANMEFNGAIVKEYLRVALKSVNGIELPVINSIKWKFGGLDFEEIGEWQIPDAGYFKINEMNIQYLPYELADI